MNGRKPEVDVTVDGAMTFRGETAKNYVGGVVRKQAEELKRENLRPGTPNAWSNDDIEVRFRYNQAFLSVNAMIPSIFMLMLCLIPAIMSAISIVREKETGSIANFRSTPITRFEFLVGKQLPYIAIAMINFFTLYLMAVFIFNVPAKGPFLVLLLGTFIYVIATTGFGELISSFTRSQVAAVFATTILAMVPAINFSGMLAPVSSLSGGARVIGLGFPSSWYQQISVGVFAKALGFADLWPDIAAITAIALVFLVAVADVAPQAGGVRCPRLSRQTPRFVEHKPLTFVDHLANVYHLVIKELRSIRADPVMLFLVHLFLHHFGQHGGDRRGDRSDEPVGRNCRRGRLGAFPADRRGAEGSRRSSRRCISRRPTSTR